MVTLDVPEGTLRRWKADAKEGGDDWDYARSAAALAGEGYETIVSEIVEGFTVMFQATMDQIRDDGNISGPDKVKLMATLSDAFGKMISAAGRASPKLSKLSVATDVLSRLADFIQREFPHHGPAFLEILDPFGVELSRAYNAAP